MIRKANVADLDGIMDILKSVGNDRKEAKQGFLMDNYLLDEQIHRANYTRYLAAGDFNYVYEDNQRVAAFLLAYSRGQWLSQAPSWLEDIHWHPSFNLQQTANFVLINQTAMYPHLTGQGLGSMLYEALLSDLRDRGVTNIFAETIIAPVPNFASLNFRLKQSYALAGVRYEHHKNSVYTTLVYHRPV